MCRSNEEINIIESDKKGPTVILIVDDCACNRMLLSTIIKKRRKDFIILEAEDGIDAIDIVRSLSKDGYHFHSILMDYMMPGMDGHEALTHICHILGKDTFNGIMVTADHSYTGKGKACATCESCSRTIMYKPVRCDKLYEAMKIQARATLDS